MDDSRTIEPPSGAFGIPKWIMKKGMRYEVDDFIISPPSNEDGGFFHLGSGRNPRSWLRRSSFGYTDQEMSMSVEVRDGNTIIGVCSSENFANISSAPKLVITPDGLSTKTETPQVTPEIRDVQPLLVLNLGGDSKSSCGGGDSLVVNESTQLHQQSAQKELATTTTASVEKICKDISRKTEPSLFDGCSTINKIEENKINLVGKVNLIPIATSPEVARQPSPHNTPYTTPLPSPRQSPQQTRKVMGVVMEKSNKTSLHSYFCTKSFPGSQQSSNLLPEMAEEATEVSLSSSSTIKTLQMENGINTAQSLDPNSKPVTGKRRQRPKPSSLREMNFWAPTSM